MKPALLMTAAIGIVSGVAAPVMAATWTPYWKASRFRTSDGIQREYQIDVASIARHNGVTYANHRLCYSPSECSTVKSISAHCRKGHFTPSSQLPYKRRNGNEWWLDFEVKDGTRFKTVYASSLAEEKRFRRMEDIQFSKAFKFLCS